MKTLQAKDKHGIHKVLNELGISRTLQGASTGVKWINTSGDALTSYSPIDGVLIGKVNQAEKQQYETLIKTAVRAFPEWRTWPAPKRGEIIRQIGEELRKYKESLGKLVSYETGKIYQEGIGEVQEMIDICDFAVGLSRQLYGLSMHSERPKHRMYEQYHPIGLVGIISAFNFPVAVWSWNAMLAMICGDVCIWKPSEKTPLTALACQKIIGSVLKRNGVPEGVCSLIIGDYRIGEMISKDVRIPLVSATGSTRMGKKLSVAVAERLGRSLLELGGNNAIIITPNANIKMATQAVLFGAVGTAGQRCTSTRRLIIHESIYDKLKNSLVHAYKQVRIGNPLQEGVLMGPLIDKGAVKNYLNAIEKIGKQGGKVIYGGNYLAAKDMNLAVMYYHLLQRLKIVIPLCRRKPLHLSFILSNTRQ